MLKVKRWIKIIFIWFVVITFGIFVRICIKQYLYERQLAADSKAVQELLDNTTAAIGTEDFNLMYTNYVDRLSDPSVSKKDKMASAAGMFWGYEAGVLIGYKEYCADKGIDITPFLTKFSIINKSYKDKINDYGRSSPHYFVKKLYH